MHNGLQRTPIRKQSYDQNNKLGWLAKSFQHRPRPSGKCSTTDFTTIALSLPIMNRNVAPMTETTCRTRRIGAKLKRRIHGFCDICIFTECPLMRLFSSLPTPPFHHLAGFYPRTYGREEQHNDTPCDYSLYRQLRPLANGGGFIEVAGRRERKGRGGRERRHGPVAGEPPRDPGDARARHRHQPAQIETCERIPRSALRCRHNRMRQRGGTLPHLPREGRAHTLELPRSRSGPGQRRREVGGIQEGARRP